jgi:hypothetical protein
MPKETAKIGSQNFDKRRSSGPAEGIRAFEHRDKRSEADGKRGQQDVQRDDPR